MTTQTKIELIPILQDNYAYAVYSGESLTIVDPGEATPIISYLEERGRKPESILITHHHWDHVNGIEALVETYGCPVIGPEAERAKIPHLTRGLEDEEEFTLSEGAEAIKAIETPGHTLGHLVYYFTESGLLLAGDTLFSMGCGRVFEGSMEQMWQSMEKINALPDETMIYCGHEYTLANAKFCLHIEPDNKALERRYEEVQALRKQVKPTIPVSLKREKETNVFLRAGSPEHFAELRTLKDNF